MIRILSEEKLNPVDKADRLRRGEVPSPAGRGPAARAGGARARPAGLEPLLKAASLEQSRGRSDAARARFQELLDLEPDWPQALESYAYFLFDQSVQSRSTAPFKRPWPMPSIAIAWRLSSTLRPSRSQKASVSSPSPCGQLGSVLVIRGQAG